MAKYHLKENGDPARCEASVRDCPRGGADSHYDSKRDARRAYEREMESNALLPARRTKLSLMERLRGVSPAALKQKELRNQLNFIHTKAETWPINSARGSGAVRSLIEDANKTGTFQEETVELASHWLAIEEKRRKLYNLPKEILAELEEVLPAAAQIGTLSNSVYEGRSFKAGRDTPPGLKETIKQIFKEEVAANSEQSTLIKEIDDLHRQVVEEQKLDLAASNLVSMRVQQKIAEAKLSQRLIPDEESVAERRLKRSIRTDVMRELQARGLL